MSETLSLQRTEEHFSSPSLTSPHHVLTRVRETQTTLTDHGGSDSDLLDTSESADMLSPLTALTAAAGKTEMGPLIYELPQ